jgi:hypothetical protein
MFVSVKHIVRFENADVFFIFLGNRLFDFINHYFYTCFALGFV